MAVRDNEQQRSSIDRPVRDLPWQAAIGHLPSLLAIGAAMLYGYLSICYTRFYGALKVDPSDVGLSYTGTLARSPGFAATLLVAITLIPFLQIPTWLPAPVRASLNRRRTRLNVALLVSVMSIAFGITLGFAVGAAHAVKAGKPMRPLQVEFPGGASLPTLLAIHAEPATVEPAGKPGDSPALEHLQDHDLLYLGQSAGTMVLFDAESQQAIYVPSNSVILYLDSCDATSPTNSPCEYIESSAG
jgi:hypothetical protein